MSTLREKRLEAQGRALKMAIKAEKLKGKVLDAYILELEHRKLPELQETIHILGPTGLFENLTIEMVNSFTDEV